MKTIEKITRDGDTQIFEILTSRKEVAEFLRLELFDDLYSEYADADHIYTCEDASIAYYNKDGDFFWIAEGEKIKRPNISKITKLMQINSATVVLYGDAQIVYNEHYGDWEVDFD